jgi:hypothetical protein
MKLRDFISENKEVHHVMAFGRMSPPTTGHEVLVNKVKDVAKSVGGKHSVVLSHTQDKDKNPLSSADKLKHAKRFFPKTNLSTSSKDSPTFLSHAAELHKKGVTHLHMVAGSDRVDEYEKKLAQYNGTHKGALFNFKKITVHSAGERDPDAEGTTGMSASKMRSHASSGNFKEFKKGIPSHVPEHHAKEMFHDVRKGMQIKEENEPRIPKKEGQPDKSDKHSDLYTDEDPKGTIHGLKFATTEDAEASVRKIKSSGRSHAHKIQAAIAMEQRAKVMGKTSAAAVYRSFINSMKTNESINEEFETLLFEGVHDKSIFKVVFLAGGPGSGKDYVLDNTLAGHGMTEMNSDRALEYLMDKKGLDKTMPSSEEEMRNIIRGRAKTVTDLRQRLAILGRNGLIINGTGDDLEKTKKIKEKLESVGYESSMILVNTEDEVSKQRNIERGQRGGRTVPENIRKEKWDGVQASRPEYAKLFGENYMEFDNSEDLRNAPPDVKKAKEQELLEMFTRIKEFVSAPPKNPLASSWVAAELQKKDRLPVPKDGAEQTPHPESGAAEEARKMGLKYYGFGRYGTNGVVTHRSVHDKLVEVEKEPQKEPNVPTSGSSMKKVNEDFEDLLFEEKKVKLLRKKDGTLKTFVLRRSAAKEAHINGGEVMKHPKGYAIKIKEENDHAEINQEFFNEQKSRTNNTTYTEGRIGNIGAETGNYNYTPAAQSIGIASTEQGTGKENSTKTKITIDQIRAKQKQAREKHQESIDRGIEPGLSMATSGENLGRASGEKISLKKLGRANVIETIGAGGEDATSTSDQKELELKKQGINLKTFKANRSISS